MRSLICSGSPFEPIIGFSRAVRVGNLVAVAGTAPVAADGSVACPGDLGGQTRRCFEIALAALAEAGARPEDVIRTRVMVTDISRWREAADVHGEFFSEIRPAGTFVEVSGLINPEWLVEIEVDAVIPD